MLDEQDDLFIFILGKMKAWLQRGQSISAETEFNTQGDANLRILSVGKAGIEKLSKYADNDR